MHVQMSRPTDSGGQRLADADLRADAVVKCASACRSETNHRREPANLACHDISASNKRRWSVEGAVDSSVRAEAQSGPDDPASRNCEEQCCPWFWDAEWTARHFAVLLTMRTCSRAAEHQVCRCHARKDVRQSNSCHVIRLFVEKKEVGEQQN